MATICIGMQMVAANVGCSWCYTMAPACIGMQAGAAHLMPCHHTKHEMCDAGELIDWRLAPPYRAKACGRRHFSFDAFALECECHLANDGGDRQPWWCVITEISGKWVWHTTPIKLLPVVLPVDQLVLPLVQCTSLLVFMVLYRSTLL